MRHSLNPATLAICACCLLGVLGTAGAETTSPEAEFAATYAKLREASAMVPPVSYHVTKTITEYAPGGEGSEPTVVGERYFMADYTFSEQEERADIVATPLNARTGEAMVTTGYQILTANSFLSWHEGVSAPEEVRAEDFASEEEWAAKRLQLWPVRLHCFGHRLFGVGELGDLEVARGHYNVERTEDGFILTFLQQSGQPGLRLWISAAEEPVIVRATSHAPDGAVHRMCEIEFDEVRCEDGATRRLPARIADTYFDSNGNPSGCSVAILTYD